VVPQSHRRRFGLLSSRNYGNSAARAIVGSKVCDWRTGMCIGRAELALLCRPQRCVFDFGALNVRFDLAHTDRRVEFLEGNARAVNQNIPVEGPAQVVNQNNAPSKTFYK
jgi:hypothetical protein